MGQNYDSILKEKKVYTDPVYEEKHPLFKKSIILGIFLSLVVIAISYVIYFNTVLSGEGIFLNNMTKIFEQGGLFFDNLDFNYNLNNNYTFEGNITINNDKSYDYLFIKDGVKIKKTLENNGRGVSYYSDGSFDYIGLSLWNNIYVVKNTQLFDKEYYREKLDMASNNMGDYIKDLFLNSTVDDLFDGFYNLSSYSFILENVKNNYNNISSNKYIKKVYLENKRPIVEIDLVLSTSDVNNILGDEFNNLHILDDIELTVIMKNDAIMNEIQEIKIIINNKTTNVRQVINYKDQELVITDDQGMNKKFVYTSDSKDITLKYYKDDLLYSVLTGKNEGNGYIYMYQVIDEVYNVKLNVNNNDNFYNYLLEVNIDNEINSVLVTGNYLDTGAINEDVSMAIKYQDLTSVVLEQFDITIDRLLFGN